MNKYLNNLLVDALTRAQTQGGGMRSGSTYHCTTPLRSAFYVLNLFYFYQEPVKPRRISHPLIGKYFRHYHETFGYEANEEQAKLYPQDFEHLIHSKISF